MVFGAYFHRLFPFFFLKQINTVQGRFQVHLSGEKKYDQTEGGMSYIQCCLMVDATGQLWLVLKLLFAYPANELCSKYSSMTEGTMYRGIKNIK